MDLAASLGKGGLCKMNEERLIDLEIRIAHQEKAIAELNDAIVAQQRLIDRMGAEIVCLRDRLTATQPSQIATPAEETPPPHY